VPPPAVLSPPAAFPLRFTEVVAFRDFGPGDLSSPKGAAYHQGLNRVLVSISPTAPGRVQILLAVDAEEEYGVRLRLPAVPGG
jgi:hypothetical protein